MTKLQDAPSFVEQSARVVLSRHDPLKTETIRGSSGNSLSAKTPLGDIGIDDIRNPFTAKMTVHSFGSTRELTGFRAYQLGQQLSREREAAIEVERTRFTESVATVSQSVSEFLGRASAGKPDSWVRSNCLAYAQVLDSSKSHAVEYINALAVEGKTELEGRIGGTNFKVREWRNPTSGKPELYMEINRWVAPDVMFAERLAGAVPKEIYEAVRNYFKVAAKVSIPEAPK